MFKLLIKKLLNDIDVENIPLSIAVKYKLCQNHNHLIAFFVISITKTKIFTAFIRYSCLVYLTINLNRLIFLLCKFIIPIIQIGVTNITFLVNNYNMLFKISGIFGFPIVV